MNLNFNVEIEGRKRNVKCDLIAGDTLKTLKGMKDGRFDLIITSPPYGIGKEYETKTGLEKYLETQEPVVDELIRVLGKRGSICWQVGNYVDNVEVFPLDIFYYQLFKKHKLQLRNRMIWTFGHGLHASRRFSGRYETILWFTKSDEYVFNLDSVRIRAKYPGKRHFKGPKRGQVSGNPLGKNPSDIWKTVLEDWEKEVWEIPNVKSNHPEKTIHPCQFPVELVSRCVLALTNKGGTVLDPYAGVGSTLIGSLMNGRNAVGIDREKAYLDVARDRIRLLKAGKLKTRPIGKPIHVPGPNDKVAQVPIEWTNGNGK